MPEEITRKKSATGRLRVIWVSIEFLSVKLVESLANDIEIIRRELDLFLGTALILLGGLNWSSNKYCDGNTADYLSCTRPNAYYYYGALEIGLIILGAFFVLLWFLKRARK